jgi:hypothetical protein
MRTINFASVCGATLLGVTSFANAQGTGVSANPDQGVTPKQCWDISRNIIREKNRLTLVHHRRKRHLKLLLAQPCPPPVLAFLTQPAPREMRRHVRRECQIADKHHRNSREHASNPCIACSVSVHGPAVFRLRQGLRSTVLRQRIRAKALRL